MSGQERAGHVKSRGSHAENEGPSECYTRAFSTLSPQNIGDQSNTFQAD